MKPLVNFVWGAASIALVTFATAPEAFAQECRGGILVDTVTGKPIKDPATNQLTRCGGSSSLFEDPTMVAGAAAVVVAGTLGGLAASGAFNSHTNPTPFILPQVPSNSPVSMSGQ